MSFIILPLFKIFLLYTFSLYKILFVLYFYFISLHISLAFKCYIVQINLTIKKSILNAEKTVFFACNRTSEKFESVK